MGAYSIRSGDEAHQVEADNWMAALGSGLAHFGLSGDDLSRVVCDLDPNGTILVRDPKTEQNFVIEPIGDSAGGTTPEVSDKTNNQVKPRLAQSLDLGLDLDKVETASDPPDPRNSPAYETAR